MKAVKILLIIGTPSLGKLVRHLRRGNFVPDSHYNKNYSARIIVRVCSAIMVLVLSACRGLSHESQTMKSTFSSTKPPEMQKFLPNLCMHPMLNRRSPCKTI